MSVARSFALAVIKSNHRRSSAARSFPVLARHEVNALLAALIASSHSSLPRLATRAITSPVERSEEHTSELQSLMRISYAVFCLKKKTSTKHTCTLHDTTLQQ